MMTSSSSSTTLTVIPSNNTRTRRNINTKKKKKESKPPASHSETETHEKWRTEKQQRIYSSKLIRALTKTNLHLETTRSPSPSAAPRRLREAADRALAASAKGRTRWSRAIMTGSHCLKLKFRKQRRKKAAAAPRRLVAVGGGGGGREIRKARVNVLRLKGKSVESVRRKVKLLGRLVPGCRKEPLPVLLEEATDYIAALEMQVRAMTALTNLLSGSTLSPSTRTS